MSTLSVNSSPQGLPTVAFLKARLDSGVDHIEMFMPLIVDCIANTKNKNFTVDDIFGLLKERHGLAMPRFTISTLLKRAARKGVVKREFSHYFRYQPIVIENDIQEQKRLIAKEQKLLAQAFKSYAAQHKWKIPSNEEALDLILGFLQENKIAMLLNREEPIQQESLLSHKETRLVAEFVQQIIVDEPELTDILKDILEGLIVYNTAFLADVNSPSRQIRGLQVFFDTRFLFEALGYDGEASAALARETLQLLKNAGIQCLFFDKTLHEMEDIMHMIENNIGTSTGIKYIYSNSMARYFIKNRYLASDIRQFKAFLKRDLALLDIQMKSMPRHIPRYTLDEKKLTELITDKKKQGTDETRVNRDVDCVTAILTIRAGVRSTALADVRAIFATTTYKMISNVQKWFQDEGETGLSPIIHIRALANLAWLRKPALSVNLKMQELVTLCQAALRPSRETWERFVRHLNILEQQKSISSDESVAIVVSELTEDLLFDIDEDVDVSTLDEIIYRVQETYESKAKKAVTENQTESRKEIEESRRREHDAIEYSRQMKLRIEGKAYSSIKLISHVISVLLYSAAIVGAIAVIIAHPFQNNFIAILILLFVIAFVLLELFGILSHITHLRSWIESKLLPHARRFFGVEVNPHLTSLSLLGLHGENYEENSKSD